MWKIHRPLWITSTRAIDACDSRSPKMAAMPLKAQRQAERISPVEAREGRRTERDRLTLEERELYKVAEEQAAVEAAAIAEIAQRLSKLVLFVRLRMKLLAKPHETSVTRTARRGRRNV